MLVILIYCRNGFQVLLQQRGVLHSTLCLGVWWGNRRKEATINGLSAAARMFWLY